MRKLILAVAFVFAPMDTNVLAFEPEKPWPSVLSPTTNYFGSGNSTFSTYNPKTNSFSNGRVTDMGGGTSMIQTYDFGTGQFSSTTIMNTPSLLPSIITPLGELGK